MRKHNFEISEDIFPEKYFSMTTYKAQFYSASDLAELFFKKQIAFRTEADSLVGTTDTAVLTVNDNYFSYDTGRNAKSSFSEKEI